jgi:hypothetical protein
LDINFPEPFAVAADVISKFDLRADLHGSWKKFDRSVNFDEDSGGHRRWDAALLDTESLSHGSHLMKEADRSEPAMFN